MKSILMSIRPRHLADILNGDKTEELRKRVPKDFVGPVYLYCTKATKRFRVLSQVFLSDYLFLTKNGNYKCDTNFELYEQNNKNKILNGKVVARFWFDEFDSYYYNDYQGDYRLLSNYKDGVFRNATMNYDKLCLTESEINAYGNGKNLYAWHIKQLEIFDEPMELGQFYKQKYYADGTIMTPERTDDFRVTRAPQSWHFVYLLEEVKE